MDYKEPELAKAPRPITGEQLFSAFVRTVSAAPTDVPKKPSDQFRLYSSGGVYRLYVYDRSGAAWRYVTLT